MSERSYAVVGQPKPSNLGISLLQVKLLWHIFYILLIFTAKRGTLQGNAMKNWSMAHDLRLTTFCGLMHLCYYACAASYNTFKLKAQLVRVFSVIVARSAARSHFGLRLRLRLRPHIKCIFVIFLFFFAFVVASLMLYVFRSIAAFGFVVGDNVVGDRCVIVFLGRTTQECFIFIFTFIFLNFFFTFALMLFLRYFLRLSISTHLLVFFCIKWLLNAFSEWFFGSQL